MKDFKIINYQRNGNTGDGFYVGTFTDDDVEGLEHFVVTFDTDDIARVISATCRVLCLDALATDWRGDFYAGEIQRIIDANLAKPSAHDLMGKELEQ